ncbi:Hypothetical predicted protein [Mytilus galloprovincialis]|uniref:RNase H type-1 domain-containing protein n=1 Tax=Mytilus galloprovincialis TaxID=29158 RepID=A0A8B6HCH0_MYTGA|nr:Hypothetical predicted protein [Mytilus galloprovincialis]
MTRILIKQDELAGAVYRLKNETCPGPDNYFSLLFINGDDNLYSTLLYIMNKSWDEGSLPKSWKQANVKFIKKIGKPNYNNPSSYRPISLTSILGKLMERIVTSREARCNINKHQGQWFKTQIGLPQGSVISPLLFNIFIIDIFAKISSNKCKFADDGTIWKTGKDKHELVKELQKDINSIHEWSTKWRINLSIEKTEFCVFSRNGMTKENIKIMLQGKELKYNPNPKILGLTLDEKCNFNKHIDTFEQKAQKSLGIIRNIKGIAKISTKILIQIYQSIVLSTMLYASSVWQINNNTHIDKLNAIQRKGLALCLNQPATASTEALEVVAGILPLDLKREEAGIRQIAKIKSYKITIPIKQIYEDWKNINEPEKIISPIGKMVLQSEDMKRSTEIDSDCIESQFEFRGLAASKSPPEYWKNLGNSKTRSEEQAFQGKTIILEKIHQLKKNTTLAFTDGSCKGNPGPCGAGAAILISNSTEHVELTQPVSNRGSILLGELVAIKLVIDFLIIPNNRKNTESIKIFSDSQSAIGILTLNWKSDNYGKTIHDIKIGILALKSEGIIVSIEWTPGHADIQGNELADQLAKKAVQEAEKIQSIPIFTKQDIQKGAKDSVMFKWQNRWDTSEKGRRYYAFQQNVKNTLPKDKPSTEIYRITTSTTSLRTGFAI